jgi:hypothetical protein
MVDNYYIPQKTTGSAPETRSEAQAIQKVIQATLPEIFNYRGEVHLNITVHVHCRDFAAPAGA